MCGLGFNVMFELRFLWGGRIGLKAYNPKPSGSEGLGFRICVGFCSGSGFKRTHVRFRTLFGE